MDEMNAVVAEPAEAIAAEETIVDTSAEASAPVEQTGDYQEVDVFAWANNLVQYVDELKITLYFFNKNYVVYKTKLAGDATRQLRPLFIDDILEYILGGAEKGLVVRGFEEAESEENVLQRTRVKNVEKLVETLNWLKHQAHEIEEFQEEEHDLKRIKGVIAHCTHKDMPRSFYLIKTLPTNQVMKGHTAWMLKDGMFRPFDKLSAIKIPGENQLLVVGDDIFVFNQAKLKSLFGYDAKAASIAAKKVAEIEANFRLSFADGIGMQSLIKGKAATIKKLQKIEPSLVKQEDLLSHAEEVGVDLMTDENGAIIILDDKDMTKFVNLLNDDYMESPMTGQRYEIIKKRPLKVGEDDASLLRQYSQ
jgi:hypothetical protein